MLGRTTGCWGEGGDEGEAKGRGRRGEEGMEGRWSTVGRGEKPVVMEGRT